MAKLFSLTLISTLFLTTCYGHITEDDSRKSSDLKEIRICGLIFLVPRNMKDSHVRGIDSCVGSFESDDVSLSLDYGVYSGVTRDERYTDFNESEIRIDGKKGRLWTYRNPRMELSRNWVACIYVVVAPRDKNWPETALNMFVTVRNQQSLNIAKNIFQSIRFENNKSILRLQD